MREAGRIAIIATMLAGQVLVAAAFAETPNDNRMLCRSGAATGTHMPAPRICKTMAEWRDLEKQRDRRGDGEVAHPEGVMSQPMRPLAPQ